MELAPRRPPAFFWGTGERGKDVSLLRVLWKPWFGGVKKHTMHCVCWVLRVLRDMTRKWTVRPVRFWMTHTSHQHGTVGNGATASAVPRSCITCGLMVALPASRRGCREGFSPSPLFRRVHLKRGWPEDISSDFCCVPYLSHVCAGNAWLLGHQAV